MSAPMHVWPGTLRSLLLAGALVSVPGAWLLSRADHSEIASVPPEADVSTISETVQARDRAVLAAVRPGRTDLTLEWAVRPHRHADGDADIVTSLVASCPDGSSCATIIHSAKTGLETVCVTRDPDAGRAAMPDLSRAAAVGAAAEWLEDLGVAPPGTAWALDREPYLCRRNMWVLRYRRKDMRADVHIVSQTGDLTYLSISRVHSGAGDRG